MLKTPVPINIQKSLNLIFKYSLLVNNKQKNRITATTKQRAPAICKAFNPASDRAYENNPIIPQRVPAHTIKNGASILQYF